MPISKDGVGSGPASKAGSHTMGSEVNEEGKYEARVRAGCGDLGREEKPKFCEVEASLDQNHSANAHFTLKALLRGGTCCFIFR